MQGYLRKFIRYTLSLRGLPREDLRLGDRAALLIYRGYKSFREALRSVELPIAVSAYLRAAHRYRQITGSRYRYVTMVDLAAIVTEWSATLDRDFDAIVAVPRSGLIVGSMLATKLGKPLTTPELFGTAFWVSRHMGKSETPKRLLLVDDSVSTGTSLRQACDTLRAHAGEDVAIVTAAAIVSPDASSFVDRYAVEVPSPRIFEWNIMHSKKGPLAVDLDGVLCVNVPPGIEEDERVYRRFLETARPLFIPAFRIDAVVTNRLEKYRPETERWLAEHGVLYDDLVMWDVPAAEDRRKGDRARHKIAAILRQKPHMFWESDKKEAEAIFAATKIPVWCVEENFLLS